MEADFLNVHRQNFPYRVFPQGKHMIPGKSRKIEPFLFQNPSMAVLLYGVGGCDKHIAA